MVIRFDPRRLNLKFLTRGLHITEEEKQIAERHLLRIPWISEYGNAAYSGARGECKFDFGPSKLPPIQTNRGQLARKAVRPTVITFLERVIFTLTKLDEKRFLDFPSFKSNVLFFGRI